MIVIVAKAAGPVPKAPRSQSRMPPVIEPTRTQLPLVVPNVVYVKFAAGVSSRRTKPAPAEPMFLTSIV